MTPPDPADLIRALVAHIERNTCTHEETYRGGAIWEICHACGAKWADDQGGRPEFKWPDVVEQAYAYLDNQEGLSDAPESGLEGHVAKASGGATIPPLLKGKPIHRDWSRCETLEELVEGLAANAVVTFRDNLDAFKQDARDAMIRAQQLASPEPECDHLYVGVLFPQKGSVCVKCLHRTED